MPSPLDDEFEKQSKLQEQRQQAAISALTKFASDYSPASRTEADTFFTTSEIAQSIRELTGVRLDNAEIFQTLTDMQYSYEALNGGLDFNWLLKKD
jgi:glutamate synthase domain-containing protein 1